MTPHDAWTYIHIYKHIYVRAAASTKMREAYEHHTAFSASVVYMHAHVNVWPSYARLVAFALVRPPYI